MRAISLLASATEMIADLDCLDQLVGRSHECDYPPQVLDLPLVSNVQIDTQVSSSEIDAQIKALARAKDAVYGDALRALSIYSIDTRVLQQLQPDVIFTQTQCEVCAVSERDVTEALRHVTGLQPAIVSLAPYRLEDVWEDMLRVGQALGQPKRARQRIEAHQQRLHDLADKTGELLKNKPAPRVAMLEWLDPLMLAGNWIPQLVTYAGGQPIFDRPGEHSPGFTWEDLQAADPDVIILSPCGFGLARTMEDVAHLQQHPLWPTLRAVREGKVYAIDGNYYINRSGPRLVMSAELIANALWGEQPGLTVDNRAWQHIL